MKRVNIFEILESFDGWTSRQKRRLQTKSRPGLFKKTSPGRLVLNLTSKLKFDLEINI